MKKQLYLVITNECDLRCQHCYIEDYQSQTINLNTIEATLNKYDVEYINLFGGEPLLEKNLSLVVDIIKTFKYKYKFTCTTNLLNIDINNKNIKYILENLVNLCTSWTPKRFNKFQYNKWITNINNIKAYNNINIDLIITLTKDLIELPPIEVYNIVKTLNINNIKFEPYIGDLCKPDNIDIDLWLLDYIKLLQTNEIIKYTLFYDIIINIKNNCNIGIFNRHCRNHILTLYPNGNVCTCPNISTTISEQKLNYKYLNFNNECLNCKYFKICAGTCQLLKYDNTGCPGYPRLFNYLNNFLNN